MKEINLKWSISKARNAEHYQFHQNVLSIVTVEITKSLGITETLDAYQKMYDQENKAYLRNRNFFDTPVILSTDKQRNDILAYILQVIIAGKVCPVKIKKDASIRLEFIIHPYKKDGYLPQFQQTAAIQDMVEKLSDDANKDDLQDDL